MKRLALALVVFLCGFALLAASCASETEEPQIEEGSGDTDGETSEDAEGGSTAKVGDTLTLKGTSYKVTNATTKDVVGGQYNKTKADGVFVIVNLTLTNNKDEPATILEDAVRLVGGNGNEYTVSTDASFAYENSLLLLTEIQPDLSKKLVAVYDVPPAAVKGAKLQVSDLFSDSTGEIDLGLS